MDKPDPAADIRAWLLQVMADKNWSPAAWAGKAGIAASTLQRAIKPSYAFVTSSTTLAKLARAASVDAPNFGEEARRNALPTTFSLPIRYEVAAGAWASTDEYVDEPIGVYEEAHLIRGYEDWPQWIERVGGDSYNMKIPDGSYVHVVDTIAMGYAPKHGDTVVVVRRRAQGAFVERSLKEVIQTPFGIELWPRSFNPKWDQPLSYTAGTGGADDVEVEIVAKVLRAYLTVG